MARIANSLAPAALGPPRGGMGILVGSLLMIAFGTGVVVWYAGRFWGLSLVASFIAGGTLGVLLTAGAKVFQQSHKVDHAGCPSGEDGRPGIEGNVRDVTDQKRTEEELAQNRQRLAGIVESAMDAIITVDDQQRIVLFNRAAETMFRCPAAEALGRPVERFIPERFRQAHAGDIQHFGHTGQTNRRMGRLGAISGLRADGEEFPAEASISHVDIGGQKLFSVILRDITERKRAEAEVVLRAQELQRVNEALRAREAQLQAANRELKDFATIVSHDLKAPLRGVATLAHWIKSDYADKLDADGRENLAEIVKRVGRMDRMIEDILHYARLGRTEEKPEPAPLDELVADVVQDLSLAAHMRVRVMPGMPVVYGEPVRLRQLFQNLIGNAIKHSDKTEIEVRVDFADCGPCWQFSVVDNGPGIEERHFERIFKMFQTLAANDETDSTGVGLALVKRIVESAGGRVWVESHPGEGSAFQFTWPKGPRALADACLTEAAGAMGPPSVEAAGRATELLPAGPP